MVLPRGLQSPDRIAALAGPDEEDLCDPPCGTCKRHLQASSRNKGSSSRRSSKSKVAVVVVAKVMVVVVVVVVEFDVAVVVLGPWMRCWVPRVR